MEETTVPKMANPIERVAATVLAHGFSGNPPVDVFTIAREEGILLVPGAFTESFCGRIEYHAKERAFLLFHPDIRQARFPSRVRFSVGHELGHYFLDHHRERLIAGARHSSKSGFISEDPMEREADEFAAALLVPETELRRAVSRRGFLVLKEVLAIANRWETSPISAAIRYAKYTSEACVVVLSKGQEVVFAIASEEGRARGLGFIPKGTSVPDESASLQAWQSRVADDPVGKSISSRAWNPSTYRDVSLWEEAVALGNTDWTLAILVPESKDDD